MLANPPFNLRPDEIGRLTQRQINALYAVARNGDGSVKADALPAGGGPPDPPAGEFERFRRGVYYDGITDPAAVRRLYAEFAAGRPPAPAAPPPDFPPDD